MPGAKQELAQTEIRDIHAALAHISQYLALCPEDAHGHNLRGIFFLHLNLGQAAVSSFDRSLQLLQQSNSVSSTAAIRATKVNLARAHCYCGNYAQAEGCIRGASVEPTAVYDNAILGWTLLMQSRFPEGIAACRLAISNCTDESLRLRIQTECGRLCVAVGETTCAEQFLSVPSAGTSVSCGLRML